MYTSTNSRGFSNTTLIMLVALLLIAGGIFYLSSNSGPSAGQSNTVAEPLNTEPDPVTGYRGTILAGSESPLIEFNQGDYEEALQSDKLVVLYFYANWCPTCRAEFPLMQSAFNGLEGGNVIGFRVSFNDNETTATEKELAREFGVAYQHTKIFLRNGERVLKSPESWSEARYSSEIANALN